MEDPQSGPRRPAAEVLDWYLQRQDRQHEQQRRRTALNWAVAGALVGMGLGPVWAALGALLAAVVAYEIKD